MRSSLTSTLSHSDGLLADQDGKSAEVVNALNVRPFLPSNVHTCPQSCTVGGLVKETWLQKRVSALDGWKLKGAILSTNGTEC